MKTIEEKAKAYDEAIKRAKEWEGNPAAIDYIFPELKESEDEKVRKELIKHLKEGAEGYEPAGGSSDYQRWLAWLEKQKLMWSEDDKRKIDRIYSILQQAADTHAFSTSCRLIGDKECMELQDWLKSLRPQNHWKPSEIDITILEDVFNGKINPKDFQVTLLNVLEQLKKLKEGKV